MLADIQDKAEKVCVREEEVVRRITEQRQTQGRQEAAAAEKSAKLEELERMLAESRKVKEDVQEWAGLIPQYRDADTLDRDMLLKLVDRIEVGEARVVNGQKERQIRICYKFAGDIG